MGSCVSSLLPDNATANPTPAQGTSMLKKKNKKKRRKNGKLKGKGRLFSRFAVSADFSKVQIGAGSDKQYNEDELHRLTERMFLNGASEKACLFTQQGRKGTNQDAMLVWENFASRDDTVFCGVFDGHGPYGHMVAKKVRDALPLKLFDQWQSITDGNNSQHQNDSVKGSSNSEETASVGVGEEWFEPVDISEGDNLPEIYSVLRKSLLRAFKLMDKELKLHETIDCFCSGSTAVTIVQQGHDLVIGNVGDSRAVLATREKDNSLVPLQLTVDLKPNLPREAARIQQCKGRVFALQDEPEVARVWLPNNDSPGLAMARAFGDFCLKDYGLIAVPDISYHRITERDEFVVLATDGVWDVLSNKEVVGVVASAPTRSTAARALVDCAVRAWRLKFPTSKTDDCAVICLFLHPTDQQLEISVAEKLSTESGEMDSQSLTDTGKINILESDLSAVPSDRQDPVAPGSTDEITHVTEIEDNLKERSQSTRRLADCISTAEEEEWSALEGVTRVNSLLNLPRFSDDDKNSRNKKKYLHSYNVIT